MSEYSTQEFDKAIEILDNIRGAAIKNSKYGFDNDWITFIKKMRILTPQSSGARIQNYIFKTLGWEAIPASLNKGDVRNSLGQYFEVKVTLITTSNSCANIVQIRLWQLVSGHHIFVINTTNDNAVTHFSLSKEEMKQEVSLWGNSAHGTKEANILNQNVEWAIRINWDSNDKIYQRWVAKYKQESDFAKMATYTNTNKEKTK